MGEYKMCYQAFRCSPVQGSSHRARKLRCEDASLVASEERWSLAIVSDGHGSRDSCRSQYGAFLAVRAAHHVLNCMMEDLEAAGVLDRLAPDSDEPQDAYLLLENGVERAKADIIKCWREMIEDDYRSFGPGDSPEYKQPSEQAWRDYQAGYRYEHMYGATLEAVVAGDGFWFVIQLGDGVAAARYGDGWHLLLPADELPGEKTYSLCNSNALAHMTSRIGYDNPLALMIVTDGIDKSYANYSDQYRFYDNIVGLCANKGIPAAMARAQPALYRISEHGSGDDLAFAGMIRMR